MCKDGWERVSKAIASSVKSETGHRNHRVAVLPPQSGILRPGLRLRAASMRPHLVSQFSFAVLYMTFHGSSNASNLTNSLAAVLETS